MKGNKDFRLREPKNKDDDPWAGGLESGPIVGDGIAGTNVSMALLATRLAEYVGRPVIDGTGLEGSFDFKYEFSDFKREPSADDTRPDIVASIFASIQGIGLKLEKATGPVETIVIDHAEKPSAN